jgi:hypothetical protein
MRAKKKKKKKKKNLKHGAASSSASERGCTRSAPARLQHQLLDKSLLATVASSSSRSSSQLRSSSEPRQNIIFYFFILHILAKFHNPKTLMDIVQRFFFWGVRNFAKMRKKKLIKNNNILSQYSGFSWENTQILKIYIYIFFVFEEK